MTDDRYRIAGFTLLEIMVALSVIAIVFITVFKLHTQTLSMSYSVRSYSIAPLLAQSKLAEFESKPVDELSDDGGSFGDDHPGYTWRVTVADVESEVLEDAAKDLKQIEVSVMLDEQRVWHLRTYRLFRSAE